MARKLVFMLILLGLCSTAVFAQNVTDQPGQGTTDTASSNFTLFAVICETQTVLNWGGNLQSGDAVYYQVFSGSQGTGTALTSLRRLSANGQFSFSETVSYNAGGTVAAGSIGSIYVTISRDGSPDNSSFNQYIDDLQDGCAQPQNPPGTSTDTGVTAPGTTPSGTTQSPGTTSAGTSNILSPFGGVVNPNYVPPDKSLVVIGPREEFILPRQETPGLVFAECQDYPVAEPGIIYDTDDVVIFWSWFAQTEEQVQEHIDNANYSVTYYQVLPLPNVVRTPIQRIGGNYWVFYYSRLGNLRPGDYYIDFKLDWDRVITDGFDDYGPATDNPIWPSGCYFEVLPNLEGRSVSHNAWPYR